MIEYQNKKWSSSIGRRMSFWHQALSVAGTYHHMTDFGPRCGVTQIAITDDNHLTTIFHDEEELQAFADEIRRLLLDQSFMATLPDRYHQAGQRLLKALAAAQTDINPQTYQQFITAYQQLCPGLLVTWGMGLYGHQLLQELLAKTGQTKTDHLIATITYPAGYTPLTESRLKLVEIAAAIQQGNLKPEAVTDQLHAWLAEFQAIPVNFCEEPWQLTDAEAQLNELLSQDCQTLQQSLQDNHRSKIEAAEKTLAALKDQTIREIATALQTATTLNEYRKNIFCRVSLGYRPIFTEAAKRAGLASWQDCWRLTPHEVGEALAGQLTDANQLVSNRQKTGLIGHHNDGYQILDQTTIEPFSADLTSQSKAEPAPTELKINGMVANRGRIQGRAKIIISSRDFARFERGDILVAPYTSVDFVPIMEKAAAFVTDHGGITSHASIVSREMNKPCIIGTKRATQLFQNNDLIEVDAEVGFVRLLERPL